MFRLLDLTGRRLIAWPLALTGLGLTYLSGGLIHLAAWVRGIDVDDDSQVL